MSARTLSRRRVTLVRGERAQLVEVWSDGMGQALVDRLLEQGWRIVGPVGTAANPRTAGVAR